MNLKKSKNKDFCGVLMPYKDTKILEFNQVFESLVKRIKNGWCKNNFEKSSTTKKCEHISCWYLMSRTWTFDGMGNKYNVYREHAMKIVNFEKKKMIPSINRLLETYEKTRICYIC